MLDPKYRPITPQSSTFVRENLDCVIHSLSAEFGPQISKSLQIRESIKLMGQNIDGVIRDFKLLVQTEDILSVPRFKRLALRVLIDTATKIIMDSERVDRAEISHRLQWNCLEREGLLPEGACFASSDELSHRIEQTPLYVSPDPKIYAVLTALEESLGVCWRYFPSRVMPNISERYEPCFATLLDSEGAARDVIRTIRDLYVDAGLVRYFKTENGGKERVGVAILANVAMSLDFLRTINEQIEILDLRNRLQSNKFVAHYTRFRHDPKAEKLMEGAIGAEACYESYVLDRRVIDNAVLLAEEINILTGFFCLPPGRKLDPYVVSFEHELTRDLAGQLFDRVCQHTDDTFKGSCRSSDLNPLDGRFAINIPWTMMRRAKFRETLRCNTEIRELFKDILKLDCALFRPLNQERVDCMNHVVEDGHSELGSMHQAEACRHDTSLSLALRNLIVRSILDQSKVGKDSQVKVLEPLELNLTLSSVSLVDLLDQPQQRQSLLGELCAKAHLELNRANAPTIYGFDQTACAREIDESFCVAAEQYMDRLDSYASARRLFPNG